MRAISVSVRPGPISYRPVRASRRAASSPSRLPSLFTPEHYAGDSFGRSRLAAEAASGVLHVLRPGAPGSRTGPRLLLKVVRRAQPSPGPALVGCPLKRATLRDD